MINGSTLNAIFQAFEAISDVKILPIRIVILYCGAKHVQVLLFSVAQAACNPELWDCRTVCYRRADSFTVAGASFGSRSRVVVSLRRHVQCVVGRSRTGIARDRPLGPGFRLLFPASGVRPDAQAPGGPASRHFCAVGLLCRGTERRTKKRH